MAEHDLEASLQNCPSNKKDSNQFTRLSATVLQRDIHIVAKLFLLFASHLTRI